MNMELTRTCAQIATIATLYMPNIHGPYKNLCPNWYHWYVRSQCYTNSSPKFESFRKQWIMEHICTLRCAIWTINEPHLLKWPKVMQSLQLRRACFGQYQASSAVHACSNTMWSFVPECKYTKSRQEDRFPIVSIQFAFSDYATW